MYPYDEVPIRHDPHLGLKIHEEKIELGNPNSDIEKGEKFIKENHEIKRVAIEHDPETNQIHEFDLKAEKVFLITKKNS
ncbi:MAG: hypothetical protein KDH96_06510 [Candidatus Riesia sp.]|nr:hypothetical protein [Candidatus Riesia sp.]